MTKSVSSDAISVILSNPNPDSSTQLPEIVIQVLDLKPVGNRYTFTATDGKKNLKAVLPFSLSSEVRNGNIQNFGLIRVLDYTLYDIPNRDEKYLTVTKCEAVSPPLKAELRVEAEASLSGIYVQLTQDAVTKSKKEPNESSNLDDDTTPTQSRKRQKNRCDSEILESIEKTLVEYIIWKKTMFEEVAARKKLKDELIIKDLQEKCKARDFKFFIKPYEDITNLRLLDVVLKRKATIAERYGWDKYWE